MDISATIESTQALSLIEWKLLRHLAQRHDNGGGFLRGFSVSQSGRAIFTDDYRFSYTAEARAAAKRLLRRGLVNAQTDHGYYYPTLEASSLAATMQEPDWAPPPPRPLTDEELDLLCTLVPQRDRDRDRWYTPLELGGSNGSNHSAMLTMLVRHGYAVCRKSMKVLDATTIVPKPRLFMRAKGSRRFQATDAGREAARAWIEKRDHAGRCDNSRPAVEATGLRDG